MTGNHFLVTLERPKHAYALLTDEPQVALIFVHGFLGNPHSTWIDFQHLVDQQKSLFPLFSVSDLFFYYYPSHDQIVPLAHELGTFINEVIGLGARPKPFELRL